MQSLGRLLEMLNGAGHEKADSAKPKNYTQKFYSLLEKDPQLSQVFGGLKADNSLSKSLHDTLAAKLLQLVEVALLSNRSPGKHAVEKRMQSLGKIDAKSQLAFIDSMLSDRV